MTEKKLVDGSMALQEKQCRVITIEATEKPKNMKLRVAAYARVSSASDDQLNSFAAQNHYYTVLISGKENWDMVDIYADEAITGTCADKREDFQRLLADCRRGLIDRVLVKSISRFARNTKECLEAIRELKLLGIGIYFEKENIDTATMSGEMMTSLFASCAQAESESISGNMRWSYQKRMQSGLFITCKAPFGYRLRNGVLEIEESEAEIIRLIFDRYLAGCSTTAIAAEITKLGISSRDGKPYWQQSSISYILRNERYVGNALLQKKYTTQTLPYQKRRNHGEKEQYFVTGCTPPIVSREVFETAQTLLQCRAQKIITAKGPKSPLSQKIFCACCGAMFKRKRNKETVYWVCNTHDEDKKRCGVTQIPQVRIYDAFLRLYYKLKHHGEAIFTPMLTSLQTIRNHRMLWSVDVVELNKQISDLSSQNQMLAELKTQGLIDPDIFISQSNELTEQLRAAKLKKERLLTADGDHTIAQTQELMELLEAGPDVLDTFDAELFGELVDKIIVESNERLRFRLKNGLELTESIERTVR
jgi:DNA invertase Pin-like site-specific DNA recombinase